MAEGIFKPKIEKVPHPRKKEDLARIVVLPFADLEVGDSFYIPNSVKKSTTVAARMSDFQRKKDPTKRFTCHMTEDGIRVWRIR